MVLNGADREHAERLLLAMVPVVEVIDAFRCLTKISCDSDAESFRSGSVEEQDAFADVVRACWNEFGPSERYLKTVVRRYVSSLEKDGVEPESEGLLDLVLRLSLSKDHPPEPDESCYISFRVPPNQLLSDAPQIDSKCGSSTLLRIKVFPYHNDVALRLWEAGTFLAEYFLHNPALVSGKRVIELGAGVGLTGLVVAGCCKAADVHLTDYTEECRINLAHNLTVNKKWMLETGGTANISQGHLEWNSFAAKEGFNSTHQLKGALSVDPSTSTKAFFEADLLIAADVIYIPEVIPSLVAVVRTFLASAPNGPKQAIFGITMRNMASFNLFITELESCGISCEWVAMVQDSSLRRIFPRRLVDKDNDVRVAKLSIAEGGCK